MHEIVIGLFIKKYEFVLDIYKFFPHTIYNNTKIKAAKKLQKLLFSNN